MDGRDSFRAISAALINPDANGLHAMRILFLTFQLVVVGTFYNLVAIPVLAATFGLVYGLVTAAEYVFAALAMGIAEVVIAALPPLLPSMSGSAGAAPILTTVAAGASQAATTLIVIAAPWLLAVLFNLVCVFLAPYRGWFGKMRRWATIASVAALGCYLLPQIVILGMMIRDAASSKAGANLSMTEVAIVFLISLAWDTYFFISIALVRRMPERPEAERVARWMPAAQSGLCLLLVGGFAALLATMGSTLGGGAIVVACVVLCLSALLLLANARAVRRIAEEKRRLLFLYVFFRTLGAALVCLVLIPPVGVILGISAALLYFQMETLYLRRREMTSAEGGPSEAAGVHPL